MLDNAKIILSLDADLFGAHPPRCNTPVHLPGREVTKGR
jgi:hypothetical protein